VAKRTVDDDRVSMAPLAIIAIVLIVAVGVGIWALSRKSESTEQFASEHRIAAGEASEGREAPLEVRDEAAPRQSSDARTLAQRFQAGEIHSVRLIGDSITRGFGTDNYVDGNETEDARIIYDDGNGEVYAETPASVTCWANAFRRYAEEHGVQDFVNAGINGSFMNRLADHPDAWLQSGADVVFVALGTNDAGYYDTEAFRDAARKGIAAAAERSKTVVVLSPVSDLRPVSQLVEPAGDLGDVLKEICDEGGYTFVDTRNAVTPEMFCVDGLHPNSQGSLAIWKCIKEALGL